MVFSLTAHSIEKEQLAGKTEQGCLRQLKAFDGQFDDGLGGGERPFNFLFGTLAQELGADECAHLVEVAKGGQEQTSRAQRLSVGAVPRVKLDRALERGCPRVQLWSCQEHLKATQRVACDANHVRLGEPVNVPVVASYAAGNRGDVY